MNGLDGPPSAQPISVTQIGVSKPPAPEQLARGLDRRERLAGIAGIGMDGERVDRSGPAPASYMSFTYSLNGTPSRLSGMPAETISAPGSTRRIAAAVTRSSRAYSAASGCGRQ